MASVRGARRTRLFGWDTHAWKGEFHFNPAVFESMFQKAPLLDGRAYLQENAMQRYATSHALAATQGHHHPPYQVGCPPIPLRDRFAAFGIARLQEHQPAMHVKSAMRIVDVETMSLIL